MKLRILIWSPHISLGGGSRLLINLAEAISRHRGIEKVTIAVLPQHGQQIKIGKNAKIDTLYVQEGASLQTLPPAYLDPFDVVYVYWPHGIAYTSVRKPIVITFHDTTVFDYAPPFMTGTQLRNMWQTAMRWIQKSTEVVVSSQYMKSRLLANFGHHGDRASVIPHTASPAKRFNPVDGDSSPAIHFPNKYIIYPANTSPHKNHSNLLLAYSKFTEKDRIPLVLIGRLTETLRQQPPNWPEYSGLPTLVSLIRRTGLQIDRHIYPLGYVDDSQVTSLIGNAYALIMPSLAEGGGSYPAEEALSMGVPVLCSDIPVMREHLSRRSAEVIWFDPESPDSIVQALHRMLNDYDRFKRSAMEGMSDPALSWDEIAKEYVAVFQKAYAQYNGK